jgi:hypothetical protein
VNIEVVDLSQASIDKASTINLVLLLHQRNDSAFADSVTELRLADETDEETRDAIANTLHKAEIIDNLKNQKDGLPQFVKAFEQTGFFDLFSSITPMRPFEIGKNEFAIDLATSSVTVMKDVDSPQIFLSILQKLSLFKRVVFIFFINLTDAKIEVPDYPDCRITELDFSLVKKDDNC